MVIKKGYLEKKYWDLYNIPGFEVTGETVTIEEGDSSSTTYVVFRGPFTAKYMCRDCGTHYEVDRGGWVLVVNKFWTDDEEI